MCGRFSITKQESELEYRFNARFYTDDYVERYNIAPSQWVPVISMEAPDQIHMFRWGLIPSWAKDSKFGSKMINARAEGLSESKVYRSLIKRSRCIIPSDGFYEWKLVNKTKKPFRIARMDNNLFAMAGLYDTWINKESGTILNSFSIITTSPNEIVKEIHNRMPVILEVSKEKNWLSRDYPIADVMELLKPYTESTLIVQEVSTLVNNPLHDSIEILTS